MRRIGAVVIALFLGCGGGAAGGGGGASGGSAGAGGAGGAGISGLSDAAAAAPDGNPMSPDGPTAVAPPDARTGTDTQGTCGLAGAACGATAATCCAGNTCVNFPELGGSFCTAACVSGDGCVSGCCVPLQSGGLVCAPASDCASCKKGGETGCQSDQDCCTGSACITETSGGVATGTVCKDYCTANANCYSGCCAVVSGATYYVCSAVQFCPAGVVPPSSTYLPGTYPVTVSREDTDLYKVQGQTVWIKTQSCFQFVYYDSATLVWGGAYSINNQIKFSSGQTCAVVDVLMGH
jgi:hypothetical protein